MRTITKNLKKFKWVYNNKEIIVTDKTTEQSVVLDKVGFLSLSRFILRSLDAMRIDNIGHFKVKLSSVKEKYKQEKDSAKAQKAVNKQIKKESRHSLVTTSKDQG